MATIPTNTSDSSASAFDSLLGGYKTYIAAGLGILANFLAAFDIYSVTPEQLVAINGIAALIVLIFLRMGTKKAQVAAVSAQVSAQGAKQAAGQTATMVARQNPVQSAVAANAQSMNAPQRVDPSRFDRT